jgi:hypothetical protein
MRIRNSAGEPGRLIPALAIAGALAISVAACGGTSPAAAEEPVASEAPASVAAESVAPEPSAATTSIQVDQTIWFAGFKVTFGEARAEITEGRGGTVAIEAMFENTGSDAATFDGTLNLSSGGENATEGMGMDIPSVPGGQTGKGSLVFDVEDSFTFDDAVLTIGRAENQQAIVPLTAMAGAAVTQEPVAVAATGDGTAGDLKLELLGGEYRADQPWSHGQMEKGSFVLTLSYDATFESDFAGGFAFSAENVALKLPDGTTVGVIQDGKSQSIELIGPNATVKDAFSRFEIEDPAAGEYALLVRSVDNAEDEIPFTIK